MSEIRRTYQRSLDPLRKRRAVPSPKMLRLKVEGFQGNRNFEFSFNDQVNFFIGRNGSGKTQLINLINATLNLDFKVIAASRFRRISLQLLSPNSGEIYEIEVIKSTSDKRPSPEDVEIAIRRPDREAARVSLKERNLYALGRYQEPEMIWSYLFGRGRLGELTNSMLYPKTTWLSITRSELSAANPDTNKFNAPIDARINDLSNRIVQYLSFLDAQAASATEQFQKEYFLSIISSPELNSFRDLRDEVSKLDLYSERILAENVFNDLKIAEREYISKLDRHFSRVDYVVTHASTEDGSFDAVATLNDTLRLHELVQQWQRLEDRRQSIFRPKDLFVDLLNDFLQYKQVEFNERNQPQFFSEEMIFNTGDLSSGEKQMFIILSEALLQEQSPTIYLADEPELSLHVEWQNQLVPAIIQLNPTCQILFATHSPDLVGVYQSNIFNLERLG